MERIRAAVNHECCVVTQLHDKTLAEAFSYSLPHSFSFLDLVPNLKKEPGESAEQR